MYHYVSLCMEDYEGFQAVFASSRYTACSGSPLGEVKTRNRFLEAVNAGFRRHGNGR